jgi:hypothetical protein
MDLTGLCLGAARSWDLREIWKRTRHHINPRSRFKRSHRQGWFRFRGNIVRKPCFEHRAWHSMFGLLNSEEAIEHIDRFYEAMWRMELLHVVEYYLTLFGDVSPEEAKEAIRRDWIRPISDVDMQQLAKLRPMTHADYPYWYGWVLSVEAHRAAVDREVQIAA